MKKEMRTMSIRVVRKSAALAVFLLSLSALAAAQTSGPLSAADSSGRIIALKSPAKRVVSLSPAATEVLYSVGAGAALVGDTSYCDYPESAKALPKVGGFAAATISVERIFALKPDLVISAGAVQAEVEAALAKLGVPVYAYDPQTFAAIADGMVSIGVLCGTKSAAVASANAMFGSIEATKAALASVPAEKRPTVFWEVYDEPLMSCGSSTFPHAILEAAGGRDIFSDLPGAWPRVSAEEVIRRAPDYVMGADDHGDKLTVAAISKRPGWNGLPAVKNGRVLLFKANIVSRAGPRVAEGVRAIARALYPALFK
jgi:iron complex transport system substrate-binding protein